MEEPSRVKIKFLSFLYGAYLTRSVWVRTRNGLKRHAADLDCCSGQTRTAKILSDLYHNVSTVTLLVSSILFIIFKLSIDNNNNNNYYLRCYSPRFVLFQYVHTKNCYAIGAMFGLLHVCYRYLARVRWRDDLEISMISFVLEGEQEFRECLELGPQINSSGASKRLWARLSRQRPMLDIMYYRFRDPILRKHQLRLRPNRDANSRGATFNLIDTLFMATRDAGLLISVAFWLVSSVSLLACQRDLYPNCDTSSSLAGYLIRNASSIFILFFHAADNFLLLTLSTMTSPLLIYDLDKYLTKLMERIRALRHQLASRRGGELATFDRTEHGLLARDLADLQASLVDFFGLVRQTDKFVSVVTPYAMFVWLICNGFLTLSGMQLAGSFELVFIRLTQGFGFLLTSTVCCAVLEFKRRT